MSKITQQQLKAYNIAKKLVYAIEKIDPYAIPFKTYKVKLEGEDTGFEVELTKKFLDDKNLIISLEEIVGRTICLGTRHIYVGKKLL